ncbi:MAG TPA: S8 family serine peptidase [Verrucomicrobiae bacterium]|nr:S8 family serine peptidase [Verrucomicrobiae bacterium]
MVFWLALPVGGHAQEFRWDAAGDRVSADLLDAPLKLVLQQIRVATGWEVAVEPGVQHTISTTFSGLKSGEALPRLLRPASFALIHRTNAAPRLLVFNTSLERATEAVLEAVESDNPSVKRLEDEWIVTLRSGTDAEELARKLGAKILGRIDNLGTYRLKFEDAAAAEAARALLDADESVQSVDANYAIDRPAALQPLSFGGAALPKIRAASGEAGGFLTIGIVDTAIRPPPGELAQLMLPGIAIAGEYSPTGAAPTHGEAMLNNVLNEMAAALGGAEAGFRVINADVFGSQEYTSTFQLGQGLVEVYNQGASLINASIGSKSSSDWLNRILDQLTAQGAVIVAPSGNTPDGLPTYPAAHPNVLAVTATNPNGQLASYANFASFVDVAMPGSSIVTLTGVPYFMAGTSVSAARTTGVIAGFSLRSGQSLGAGVNFIRDTRGVQPAGQISP